MSHMPRHTGRKAAPSTRVSSASHASYGAALWMWFRSPIPERQDDVREMVEQAGFADVII